jgi:hypothetical protein
MYRREIAMTKKKIKTKPCVICSAPIWKTYEHKLYCKACAKKMRILRQRVAYRGKLFTLEEIRQSLRSSRWVL